MRLLLGLVGLLLVAGCSQAGAGTPVPAAAGRMPADFAATVVYRNGSVPPEYHYEWVLRVDETTAELSWRPGYERDQESWVETVPVTGEQRAEFHRALRSAGALDPVPPVDSGIAGGPTGSIELTAGGSTRDLGTLGLTHEAQDILDRVHDAAENLLPAEVWTTMTDRQRSWGGR
ncbi:hypothetical protein [Actinophytocola gossypii]|uniref:Lipoprotein n=1 Tax=Actinophytocola gossypii TaxID=2812003 RepID=A0ABT2JHE9_9PSEU|nr:hypothetical protein [Actinophytocola gossypii]MCT2586939.1 hypothetical protein [Actinophytocola gossypii]